LCLDESNSLQYTLACFYTQVKWTWECFKGPVKNFKGYKQPIGTAAKAPAISNVNVLWLANMTSTGKTQQLLNKVVGPIKKFPELSSSTVRPDSGPINVVRILKEDVDELSSSVFAF
jgi:hypothetical protein